MRLLSLCQTLLYFDKSKNIQLRKQLMPYNTMKGLFVNNYFLHLSTYVCMCAHVHLLMCMLLDFLRNYV